MSKGPGDLGLHLQLRALRPNAASQIQTLLSNIEKTYPKCDAEPILLELLDPYLALGQELRFKNKPTEAIKAYVKGLKGVRYKIVANPPLDEKGKLQFEVTRWGMPDRLVFMTLLRIHDAYLKLAPELCPAVRGYAETAYTIIAGESDTFNTVTELLKGR
ncbi:SET protein [Geosmithia morbida]|uniref:SET protein n=1 Tax=Geosmithia morbida TaxID=1094350 RepID=A0A9P4Z284_9HYPO|nr:SET protein [Geosmithia morbida]KAF4125923.1 SET protein [Geosmithia morbida]